MRGRRVGMGLLSATLLTLAACQTPNTTIKPPLHEVYTLPPTDDARFSSPPNYPKETLDSSQLKKPPTKPNDQFPSTPGGRMGPTPGGMGGL
jgi:hypothetical protein